MRDTFGGLKVGTIVDWHHLFEVTYNDDGSLYLTSKESYEYNEDGTYYRYRYCIHAMDLYMLSEPDATGSEIYIKIFSFIEPEYWCDETMMEAARMNGWEEYSREELNGIMNAQDAVSNGLDVLVETDTIPYSFEEFEDGVYDILECKDAVEAINVAASSIEFYDATSGFIMDRAMNGVGTTGWDVMNQALTGKDAIETSITRMIKAMETEGSPDAP